MNVPESTETTLEFSEGALEVLESSDVTPEADATVLSRRTVVRSAAVVWGAPVILAVAPAPAFAASPLPPKFGQLTACKLPGKSDDELDFGYRFAVPFTGSLGQIQIVTLTLNGRQYTPINIRTDGTNLIFEVTTNNSADASGSGIVVYTFNGQTMPPEPFSYDGTKPCKI